MKTLEERFWGKVKKSDGCWEWMGALTSDGYGNIKVGGKAASAHRLSFEMANGPIPTGMCICHKCDTPSCVNPNHLFTGTTRDNIRDMMEKKRGGHLIGEQHGRSKLKAVNIPAIREAVFSGASKLDIARCFGVTHNCIYRVSNRQTWGHVT